MVDDKKCEKYLAYSKIIVLILAVIVAVLYLLSFSSFLLLFRPEFDTTLSPEHKVFVYAKMIEAFRNTNKKNCNNQYCKRPETQHVDCGRVLRGDREYLKTLTGPSRIPLIPDPNLNMTCSAIYSRVHQGHLNFKPLKLNGTAFARIVYKDYEFIEKQIQVSYHLQNVFCFVVDKKSPVEFYEKMKRLQECLPNVIVLPATESYDSNGHSNNLGHYRCMEALLSRPDWSYLILLQNYDVLTKSVYEMDRIFELLGGVNDVAMSEETPGRRKKHFKWDPKSLRLFKNETGIEESILNSEIKISSGFIQGSLSRAAIKWMVNTVDLSIFIDQWNQTKYGGDEQFINSLQINSNLGMPGHFTDECILQKLPIVEITRMTRWAVHGPSSCATKTVRNEICIFGIEDFRAVAKMPTLMFNKMIPSFDYSIVECTAELLYNRTFLGQVDTLLNEEFYENLVSVQYHKHHKEPGYVLNCTSDVSPWNYEDYL